MYFIMSESKSSAKILSCLMFNTYPKRTVYCLICKQTIVDVYRCLSINMKSITPDAAVKGYMLLTVLTKGYHE